MRTSQKNLHARLLRPALFFKAHKWLAGFTVALVLLLFVSVAYGYHSYSTWREIDRVSSHVHDDMRGDVARIMSSRYSLEQVEAHADQLSQKLARLCDEPALVAWQIHVSRAAKSIHNRCHERKAALARVQQSLHTLLDRAKSEIVFAGILSQTHNKLQAKASDYGARKQIWEEFHARLTQLQVHASLAATREAALGASKEISAAYDVLLQADAAQTRADYDQAVADVQKTYSKLGSSQNLSTESFGVLLDGLQKEVQRLDT